MASKTALIKRIAKFNRDRDPDRLALKYKVMQRDALAFFRGTCHLYCEDWPQTHSINKLPLVWVCGDLHVENFGTYKGDNRLVYFDIADFDEAFLAPVSWDLARLSTSALVAAKMHGLRHRDGIALCNAFLDAYTQTLREGKARWIERATAQGLIGGVFQKLQGRTRRTFINKRTTPGSNGRRLRIDNEHTMSIDRAVRKRIKKFMRKFAVTQADPGFFKMIDVARRVAGTGSLGLERYTILIEGRGSPAGHVLLDLKFASASALAPYVKTKQPRWKHEATRIVEIGRRMQAIAPAFLHAVTIGSRSYVLRELMPSQDKVDLEAPVRKAQLELLVRDFGLLVASSELRSSGRDGSATTDELISFAQKRRWRKAILEYAEHYREKAWHDWGQFRAAYRDKAIEC